jgi:hypothetical protein
MWYRTGRYIIGMYRYVRYYIAANIVTLFHKGAIIYGMNMTKLSRQNVLTMDLDSP